MQTRWRTMQIHGLQLDQRFYVMNLLNCGWTAILAQDCARVCVLFWYVYQSSCSIMCANLHDVWQDLFVSMLNAVSVHYLFDAAFVSMLNAISVHYLFDAANTSIQQWMFTFVFNKCSKLKKRSLFLLV